MPTRIPIPQIGPSPAVALSIVPLDDAAETTIITVQLPGPPAYMQSYAHTRAGTVAPIGRDDALGKANSGGMRRYRDGTGRLYVSEADATANSSGSTSDVTYYDFPSAFPAQGATGGSGVSQAVFDALQAQVVALAARVEKHLKA